MGPLNFDSVAHMALGLILVAIGGPILWHTYRVIFQRSERRLTWWLMGLRTAGLLALVVVLAKPSWIRQTEIVDKGRLAIVLDNSISMSLADASGVSRYAAGTSAIQQLRDKIAHPATSGVPDVDVDLFDLSGPIASGTPPPEPLIERTDLVHAVSQAAARLRSKPLVGVVVVSDGMDNTGRDDLLALGECRVPIYPVGFREDPEAARLDLAVQDVQSPARAIIHNEIKVGVQLEKTAGPAIACTLTLKRGREEIARQEISFGQGESKQRIDLTFVPSEAGSFVYTASVSSPAGERLLANNAKHFPLKVDAEPIRILYIEGFLRLEYKFLKSRLEDDPDVSAVSVIRRANPERLAANSEGQLLTQERLAELDIVILGDIEANYLSADEYQSLIHWVDEGHALLVLGGYHSFGPQGFSTTPLNDILPVVFQNAEPFQSEDPFVLQLTEIGQRHPVFNVSGDPVKDLAMWSATPPLQGFSLVKRAKPAAEVLAVNPNLKGEEGLAPVVVVQRYGAGHTMVLACDTTWRWSRFTRMLRQSDTLFTHFWGQTVRWLAGRKGEEDRPPVTVSTDQPAYGIGRPVSIRVIRQPQPEQTGGSGEVSVEVLGESGEPVPVPAQAGSMEPDAFTSIFYPTTGGRYTVVAKLSANGQTVANQTTEFLVHGSDLELADTRTNQSQLQAIANVTGGLYVNAEDAATLAGKIERRERRTPVVLRSELWDSPAFFMFFIAAISAEWVIRRRNHLV